MSKVHLVSREEASGDFEDLVTESLIKHLHNFQLGKLQEQINNDMERISGATLFCYNSELDRDKIIKKLESYPLEIKNILHIDIILNASEESLRRKFLKKCKDEKEVKMILCIEAKAKLCGICDEKYGMETLEEIRKEYNGWEREFDGSDLNYPERNLDYEDEKMFGIFRKNSVDFDLEKVKFFALRMRVDYIFAEQKMVKFLVGSSAEVRNACVAMEALAKEKRKFCEEKGEERLEELVEMMKKISKKHHDKLNKNKDD